MAAKILADHLTGNETAFSEDNLLVVSTGPMTGSGAPSSSRFNISTLSPQTGYLTSSNCGGNFGYYLKKAGLDAIVLHGRSDTPVWLEISNGKVQFHAADDLWGMKTSETQATLDEKLKLPNGRVRKNGKICIGPAGENKVLYAGIVSNERVAGRGGTGAVLGWMNVKAVCASGNQKVKVIEKEKMINTEYDNREPINPNGFSVCELFDCNKINEKKKVLRQQNLLDYEVSPKIPQNTMGSI